MGGEESKAQAQEQQAGVAGQKGGVPEVKQTVHNPNLDEYEGIPPVSPMIAGEGDRARFPADIQVPSGTLPETHRMIRAYFERISFIMNRNEEQLTATVKRQLEEYINIAPLLATRKVELEARLARILSLFTTFDSEVKIATDMLALEIDKADRIAAALDADIPSFQEFRK